MSGSPAVADEAVDQRLLLWVLGRKVWVEELLACEPVDGLVGEALRERLVAGRGEQTERQIGPRQGEPQGDVGRIRPGLASSPGG